jgi:hypothetical protein
MCCPRPAVSLVLVDHRIESALDGLGFGLRPENLLRFFELGLIEDQMFIPALAGSIVYLTHLMYIIPTRMYISNIPVMTLADTRYGRLSNFSVR